MNEIDEAKDIWLSIEIKIKINILYKKNYNNTNYYNFIIINHNSNFIIINYIIINFIT